MQDIHSIGGGGGGGRLYGGGGVGDRRLRPQPQHHHNHNHSSLQGHQAMKCPRCESINTKFCYYNNYNLSQPRHFCKSCRRYWTKGGVLRNVPVGGGCRKTKRSKPKQSSSSSASVAAAAAAASIPVEDPAPVVDQRKSPNSNSSSESSSLTATANAAAAESVSVSQSSTSAAFNCNSNNHSVLNRIGESKLFGGRSNLNPSCFETASLLEQGSAEYGIFPEIGSFTNLISSTTETMPFGFGGGGDNLLSQQQGAATPEQAESQNQQWKMEAGVGLIDGTIHDEFRSGGGGGGFGSLDWQEPGIGGGGGEAGGLFDLASGVDESGYWSQSQWTTTDQDSTGLYLP